MKRIKEVSDLIYNELNDVCCNNCRYNIENGDGDICQDCHRKYVNWEISRETSEYLAKKIGEIYNNEKDI